MRGFVVITVMVFILSPCFAGDRDQQETVPTFTDQDLEKYSDELIVGPDVIEQIKGEDIPLPLPERPLDADTILKKNSRAVLVVVAYDKEGAVFSHGSGFIIRPDGAFVTSYHVVGNAADVKIKAGGRVLDVEGILYIDKENDIAVLKARGGNLQTVKLAESDGVDIGDRVFVMSSPRGTKNTISEGILSSIKELSTHRKMLQITAPISQGSSGGPVLNKNGEVIGIATSAIKQAFAPKDVQNLNFAVPVDLIKDKISATEVITLRNAWAKDYKLSARYWLTLGNKLNKSAKYPDAIEAYKKALSIDPDLSGAYNGLGVAYMNVNKYKEAIEAYRQALSIEPDSAWVHSNLGLVYAKSGMYQEAISTLKKAVEIMPNLAVAHFNLGITYRRSGKYQEAIDAYKEAIRINPDFTAAHFDLGLTYLDINNRSASEEEYKTLKKLNPALADRLLNLIQ